MLAAVTLVTALGVLFESGLRAGVPPQRYAGAPVVVGAQQSIPVVEDLDRPLSERVPLPVDVVDEVAAVPGVERVVADRTVAVTIDGRPVAGHGWSTAALTPFSLRDGEAPRADGVVLDSALAAGMGVSVGDQVDIAIGAVPRKFTVTGVTAEALERESTLFFTDEQALDLYGRPKQVDAVGVLAEPGVDADTLADRIAAALPSAVVYTGDARGDVEFLDVGQVRSQLILLSLAFAGTAIMIAMLVVGSTLALSVQQRRRELALLRAVAATPRQVHRMIGAEILLVAGIAAVLGAVPGYAAAYGLRAAFAEVGMLPADFGLAISPLPGVVAIVLCLVTARAAGWVAARRVAKIQPVEALRESDVDAKPIGRWRVRVGLVMVALGTGRVRAAGVPAWRDGGRGRGQLGAADGGRRGTARAAAGGGDDPARRRAAAVGGAGRRVPRGGERDRERQETRRGRHAAGAGGDDGVGAAVHAVDDRRGGRGPGRQGSGGGLRRESRRPAWRHRSPRRSEAPTGCRR